MTQFDRVQRWRGRLQDWRTTTDDAAYGDGLALLVRECTDEDLKLAALVCSQNLKLEAFGAVRAIHLGTHDACAHKSSSPTQHPEAKLRPSPGKVAESGKPLLTLDNPANENLMVMGATTVQLLGGRLGLSLLTTTD